MRNNLLQRLIACAASASQMGRFETRWLTVEKNLLALVDLSGQWIDKVHARHPSRGVVLDMDSSVSPTHGEQEMSVWNGHYECTCYHALFVFNKPVRRSGALRPAAWQRPQRRWMGRRPGAGRGKPLRRRPAAHRRTATAASHVNNMRRSVSRVRQNPQEKCVLIAKSSALSTFDLASACLGAVRRRAGGSQADGSGLQRARNGRRLALTGSNLADVGVQTHHLR